MEAVTHRDWTRARAKVRFEGRCRVCGVRWGLEAAHVIPRSVAPNAGEHPDAIVPLCRSRVDFNPATGENVAVEGCHNQYDRHALDLEPYLTAKEAARAVLAMGSLEGARRIVSGRREST